MSWTTNVTCSRCGGFDWGVIDGQWTCGCLHVMSVAEIAEYHATLCNCSPKDRVIVGSTCQACRRGLT